MDQDRQIRFAIPPFFLFASLIWGAYLGGLDLSLIFELETAEKLLGFLAATAVAIVPTGFLISTLSVVLLKAYCAITGNPTYEARLTESTFDRIWSQLSIQRAKDKKLTLYVATTFDHELLSSGIHTWLLRRWNSFNVATHSIVALLLAHLVALIFSIPQVWTWWLSTLFLVVLLAYVAWSAWSETMTMIEFQSYREQAGGGK